MMITYSELFQFCLVLIGFAGLILQMQENDRPHSHEAVIFLINLWE